MGVPGSAFALVLSQAFSALLCVWYVKKHFPILHLKKKDWIIDWKKEFNFALRKSENAVKKHAKRMQIRFLPPYKYKGPNKQ